MCDREGAVFFEHATVTKCLYINVKKPPLKMHKYDVGTPVLLSDFLRNRWNMGGGGGGFVNFVLCKLYGC
jgi:hypothetical protein